MIVLSCPSYTCAHISPSFKHCIFSKVLSRLLQRMPELSIKAGKADTSICCCHWMEYETAACFTFFLLYKNVIGIFTDTEILAWMDSRVHKKHIRHVAAVVIQGWCNNSKCRIQGSPGLSTQLKGLMEIWNIQCVWKTTSDIKPLLWFLQG